MTDVEVERPPGQARHEPPGADGPERAGDGEAAQLGLGPAAGVRQAGQPRGKVGGPPGPDAIQTGGEGSKPLAVEKDKTAGQATKAEKFGLAIQQVFEVRALDPVYTGRRAGPGAADRTCNIKADGAQTKPRAAGSGGYCAAC